MYFDIEMILQQLFFMWYMRKGSTRENECIKAPLKMTILQQQYVI